MNFNDFWAYFFVSNIICLIIYLFLSNFIHLFSNIGKYDKNQKND